MNIIIVGAGKVGVELIVRMSKEDYNVTVIDRNSDLVDKLTDIFSAAAEDSDFQQLLRDNGCFPMNVSGDEAVEYVKSYRSITSWLLYNSGATQNSPEDFGIEKP